MSDPRYSLAFRLCRLIKFQAHHCNAVSVVFVQNITQVTQFRFPSRGFTFMRQALPKTTTNKLNKFFYKQSLKDVLTVCQKYRNVLLVSWRYTCGFHATIPPHKVEIRRSKGRERCGWKTGKENLNRREETWQSPQYRTCHLREVPMPGRPSGRPEASTHLSRLAVIWPAQQIPREKAPSHA